MSRSDLAPQSSGERTLQDLLGTRDRAQRFYERQVLDHLSEPMRQFIGQQQMMFVATSDARGTCDSTLRAGPPGFVAVLDAHRLAWPEYRGNGVMASRGNIIENPHVGLLFVDFVRDVIGLHVNGSATVVDDRDLRRDFPTLPVDTNPGRRPEQWVVTEVEEAYIHCAKFIPRLYPAPAGDLHPAPAMQAKGDYFAVTRGADDDGGGPSADGPTDHVAAGSVKILREDPSLTCRATSTLPPGAEEAAGRADILAAAAIVAVRQLVRVALPGRRSPAGAVRGQGS
jgi:predicted pyridoxine 5'-phosphate oxidase superfamily flavin-nucleotide-binding protein